MCFAYRKDVKIKKVIALCCLISMPLTSIAGKLNSPPSSIIGIGASPCSDFVSTYDSMQRISEETDVVAIAGIYGAYGDFTGTFGGFLASSMLEHGYKKIPFKSKEHAMSLAYQICKENPNIRYIDVVYTMSKTAFGRSIK